MDQGTGQAELHGQVNQGKPRLQAFVACSLVFLVAVLAFSSAFFYQRYERVRRQADKLNRANHELQLTSKGPAHSSEWAPEARAEVERQIRAVYEARDAAITSELNELYAMEAQLREKYELPAKRTVKGKRGKDSDAAVGGQGGGASVFEGELFRASNPLYRPPTLIYGLSRPSADLLVQEIRLRSEWFGNLIRDMDRLEQQAKVVSHTPGMWPSVHPQARLSSRFGYRRDPITGAVRHHDGTDISAPYGSSAIATADGTVVFAGWDGDLGNLVKISHGKGLETWYAHLQKYTVRPGQQVARGDQIGKVGTTGRTTGAHIHYEVRMNGRPVDSGDYLGN